MNRSEFPERIDSFLEHFDPQARELPRLRRFQELRFKSTLTQPEVDELASLTDDLREKIFTAEDFNKLQDAITNMQLFFRDNVQGYISDKQGEMESFILRKKDEVGVFVDNKMSEVSLTCDNAIIEIIRVKEETIGIVDRKTNEALAKVKQGETSIIDTALEFARGSKLYFQSWKSKPNQVEFNIYEGENKMLGEDAVLNFSAEDIFLVLDGVMQTPYKNFYIKDNGKHDTVVMLPEDPDVMAREVEIYARWYKNVGKVFLSHALTHGEEGQDTITVTEGMLDDDLKKKVTGIEVGGTVPSDLNKGLIWIDTN